MIIKQLDKEGINLQETRLNLISQGYVMIWLDFLMDCRCEVIYNLRTKFIEVKMKGGKK